jgi:hypothetical protein
VDVTNPSATVGVLEGGTGGAYNANATMSGGVYIVAREVSSDYERKISVSNTTFVLGAGNTQLRVRTPNSENYVYDVYAPPNADGSGTPKLFGAGRVAAHGPNGSRQPRIRSRSLLRVAVRS